MSIESYEKAVELMDSHKGLQRFVDKRDVATLEKAESVLGVRFPSTYRRFLLEYGAGCFGASEIYGVITEDFENSSVPDAIWYTLSERQESQLPDNLIVVSDDGMGGLYCLKCLKIDTEDGEVVSFNPGLLDEEQEYEIIFAGFGEMLLQLVQEEIES